MLRHDQLAIRLVEMRATLDVMNRVSEGKLGENTNRLQASRTVDWEQWRQWSSVETGMWCLRVTVSAGQRRIITMDPAIQRIEPWSKPIPCPLLSINSEWFTHDDGYARLLALTRTVRGPKHVLGIAGTIPPSFADVFLITPSVVGGQTGLVTSPYEVFLRTFEAVDVFLDTQTSEEEKRGGCDE
ncbi:hypothetical protein JCM24511_05660 [Saitozyma sp. JCM 24511]|nr:hypothetical protein JCM24511_05660 [Saitozyma sp. JCM 24511]